MADDLDDFLTRIDTPVLNKFSMSFFLDHAFDVTVPHLTQLTGQAKGLKPYKVARVALSRGSIQLSLTEPPTLSLGMVGDRICLKVHAIFRLSSVLSNDLTSPRTIGPLNHKGKTTQCPPYFSSFSSHLLPSGVSMCPRALYRSSHLHCSSSLGQGPQKCCPTYVIFSWGDLRYPELY
ncbi:hypothetical protein BC826DRAFT_986330 [Russula brevipes]|nr:hypothetical protein BC826DRAFT_986330 [Russula brevipes]